MTEEREFRKGERKGCDDAYEYVLSLDARPRDVTVTVPGKAPIRIPNLTGKMLLRLLARGWGDRVAENIKKAVNLRLIGKGMGDWPLRK